MNNNSTTEELNLEIDMDEESSLITHPRKIIEDTVVLQPERRSTNRNRPASFNLRAKVRQLIDALVVKIDSGWPGWLMFAVFNMVSLALLWWSIVIRINELSENHDLSRQYSDYQLIFSELTAQWSSLDEKTLKQQMIMAENKVFDNYEFLARWLRAQADTAKSLGLNMSYSMTESVKTDIRHVRELPIEIHIRPDPVAAQQAYYRILEFIHSMISEQWHLEIVSTNVLAGETSVNNLVATIHTWVQDDTAEENHEIAIE